MFRSGLAPCSRSVAAGTVSTTHPRVSYTEAEQIVKAGAGNDRRCGTCVQRRRPWLPAIAVEFADAWLVTRVIVCGVAELPDFPIAFRPLLSLHDMMPDLPSPSKSTEAPATFQATPRVTGCWVVELAERQIVHLPPSRRSG